MTSPLEERETLNNLFHIGKFVALDNYGCSSNLSLYYNPYTYILRRPSDQWVLHWAVKDYNLRTEDMEGRKLGT